MKTHLLILALFGALVFPVLSQDASTDNDDELNRLLGNPTEKKEDAAAKEEEDAELRALLGESSPEEQQKEIQKIALERLTEERREVVAELKASKIYKAEAVAAAVKTLEAAKVKNQNENIRAICDAIAAVDSRFTLAWREYQAKKFEDAAGRLKGKIQVEQDNYAAAAMQYIYGESLRETKKIWDAIEAYTNILVNQPRKICFAAESAKTAAALYESMNRGQYAIEMYTFCLENYGLTLSQAEAEAMVERLEELMANYELPLDTLTKWMGESAGKLEKTDFAQAKKSQQDAVILLEDLIKTIEEKNRQKDEKDQKKKKQKEKKPGEGEKKPGEKKPGGEKPGGEKPGGKKPGNPRGPKPGGAKKSQLVPGKVTRPSKLTKEHRGTDSGKWSELSPRQKERIENAMKQKLAEKRGGLVRDYHRKLAEDE